jgi:hypothetical protein
LLDGDGDGNPGGDFVSSFTIGPVADSLVISLPDFVRGPGQPVNVPADVTTGLPLSISDGTGVVSVDLQLSYDPSLLEISGATPGTGVPAGASVTVDNSVPGLAIVSLLSPTALPGGPLSIVNLTTNVPADSPSAIYGMMQVVDLHTVAIRDAGDNLLPAIADDAFHLATFFGDVSANGRINASDAARVARIAALLDTGFDGSPLADPFVVGDITSNGRLNAADASRVARFAALIPVAEIPPLPAGIVITNGSPVAFPVFVGPLPAEPALGVPQSTADDVELLGLPILTGDGIRPASVGEDNELPSAQASTLEDEERSLDEWEAAVDALFSI